MTQENHRFSVQKPKRFLATAKEIQELTFLKERKKWATYTIIQYENQIKHLKKYIQNLEERIGKVVKQ